MNDTRPTSMRTVRPVRSTLAAARLCEGISSVRLKSPPVPLGRIPSSTSLPDVRIPLATSETVPSPPQAIINFAPLRAASPARAAASPRLLVKTTRNGRNCERKSLAICGQASPVLPPAEAGLTITTDMFDLCNRRNLWMQFHGAVLLAEVRDLFHHEV